MSLVCGNIIKTDFLALPSATQNYLKSGAAQLMDYWMLRLNF